MIGNYININIHHVNMSINEEQAASDTGMEMF